MQVKKMMENLRRRVGTQPRDPKKGYSNGPMEKNKENGTGGGVGVVVMMGGNNNNNNNNHNNHTNNTNNTNNINNNNNNKNGGKDSTNHYNEKDLLTNLPSLSDVTDPEKKRALLIKKLKLCNIVFDFSQPDTEQGRNSTRAIKRQCLIELVEYISQTKQCFGEEVIPYVLEMLSNNLFRSLPPPMYADFDPEEDEPNFDPAWPHLQFIYEFFHRFIMTVDVKLLRKYMDKKFLLYIVDLFNSEDPRERDYLKMILHRIYGRCMPFRSFIRKAINNALFPVIYENRRHNGIGELLEILGSIINGFAIPLKDEHVQFLRQVLIPLHKTPTLSQFHQQLAYCVTQFIQKDPSLAGDLLSGMLRFWPVKSCQKEILFLNELEEVLELTGTAQIEKVVEPLFKRIGTAICSNHFQVAERALFLWNNDIIATFTSDHRDQVLPIIFPALQHNYAKHWNTTVSSLTLNIIRIFKEMDKELYEEISKKYKTQKGNPETNAQQRAERWKQIKQHNVVG